jgi:hypothetical protein
MHFMCQKFRRSEHSRNAVRKFPLLLCLWFSRPTPGRFLRFWEGHSLSNTGLRTAAFTGIPAASTVPITRNPTVPSRMVLAEGEGRGSPHQMDIVSGLVEPRFNAVHTWRAKVLLGPAVAV